MPRIVAATGLRRGEALGLGWGDVDLDAGPIHVVHNAVMFDGELVIGEPKTTRSKRRGRIGPDSCQVVRDHLGPTRAPPRDGHRLA
jgi:integrase